MPRRMSASGSLLGLKDELMPTPKGGKATEKG